MKSQWFIVLGLAFAFLTAIIAVSNNTNVTLDYLFGEVDVSLIIVISASVLIGGAIVAIFGMRQPIQLKHENQAQKKLIQSQEDENRLLRNELDEAKTNYAVLEREHNRARTPEVVPEVVIDTTSADPGETI